MSQLIVVDTGFANFRSVERALEAAARGSRNTPNIERTADPERIAAADRLVVPGQGAFADCSRALSGATGEAVLEQLKRGRPFLGICLGLQVLFESSEEAPGVPGLGWFAGSVRRLTRTPSVKIPHMGWNSLNLQHSGHPCLEAAGGQGSWFYFVHSYHAVPRDETLVKASVTHGENTVTAAVARDNVLATQFHPEKSQAAGIKLLTRFLAL